MTHPQVADGGDGIQLGRIATNILNKQLWTANERWSSRWGEGGYVSLTISWGEKKGLVIKCHKRPGTWTVSLDKQPKLRKMGMGCGECSLAPFLCPNCNLGHSKCEA
jgi:hypothetical protein